MSRRYNIKWRESDLNNLKKAVKNFNAKVTRLEKKYQGRKDIVLPEKTSVKEMKKLIGTRRDLQREVNSLQRFSKRGAEKIVDVPETEHNIKITNWQKTEMNRRTGIINRQRKEREKKISEIPMRSGGKDLGYDVGEFGMGKAEKLSLHPTRAFTDKMDKYSLKAKFRSLVKHSQSDYFAKADQRLLDNYRQSLIDTYGEDAVKDILDQIDGMDFNEFYKIFRGEPGAFEFASDLPDDADIEAYLTKVRSTWLPNYRD